MFKLEIKNADGSHYWTEYFDLKIEAEKWLAEEKTRPYWKSDLVPTTTEIAQQTITIPIIDPEKQESIDAINLGMDIIADIRMINKKKIALNQLDLGALFASQEIANIERALWNGSLGTAKLMIQALQSFYSAEEKIPIISKIDAHNTKWGLV